jgi:hypothetical protein
MHKWQHCSEQPHCDSKVTHCRVAKFRKSPRKYCSTLSWSKWRHQCGLLRQFDWFDRYGIFCFKITKKQTDIKSLSSEFYVLLTVQHLDIQYACNETNLMHYLTSVYSVTTPTHVSGLLVATNGTCCKFQSPKMYNTYQLSHIYIATSWWWATRKLETCSGVVTE